MTANSCSIEGRLLASETVGALLSPAHDVWIEEAQQFLLPATAADAPFWDRWSAVRYLNDQYVDRHRAERDLVAELRPFVSSREFEMLLEGEARIAQLRLALDRVGRQRGTAVEFGYVAAELLRALELWCAEIELAGSHVAAEALPVEARQALDNLLVSSRMRSLVPA
jgi:hypothetical protein